MYMFCNTPALIMLLYVLLNAFCILCLYKLGTRKFLFIMNQLFDDFKAPATVTQKGRRGTTATVSSDKTTSPYFAQKEPTSSTFLKTALEKGFKQTESNLPDLSSSPNATSELSQPKWTAEEWASRMTDVMRHELYLGNIPELVKHANEKHPNGMSTRQVRAWLLKNENIHHVPTYLEGSSWAIDHIISDSIGGVSHPYNFFLLPRVLNTSFSGWATLEKRRCVGMQAWGRALDLQRWYSLKAKAVVSLSQFDPVSDHYLVQRSR